MPSFYHHFSILSHQAKKINTPCPISIKKSTIFIKSKKFLCHSCFSHPRRPCYNNQFLLCHLYSSLSLELPITITELLNIDCFLKLFLAIIYIGTSLHNILRLSNRETYKPILYFSLLLLVGYKHHLPIWHIYKVFHTIVHIIYFCLVYNVPSLLPFTLFVAVTHATTNLIVMN